MTINNKKALHDVRVPGAVAAIDRSGDHRRRAGRVRHADRRRHMVPSDAGYVDLTGVNPYTRKGEGAAEAASRRCST